MREPPGQITPQDVLSAVRTWWDGSIDRVDHLPVGFGAHHWAAYADERPRLFVTLDAMGSRHTPWSLEAAYASAAALAASGLDFVLAPLRAAVGSLTVRVADGRLSVTPWVDGATGDGPPSSADDARITAEMLARLHATPAPESLPEWRPLVPVDLAQLLERRTAVNWASGPYGTRARAAIRSRLAAIETWAARYYSLAAEARRRTWVVTHGEPHARNQLRTPAGRVVLVDWESVRLAPAERDTRVIAESAYAQLVTADPEMLELFDLEWRLDEIAQYADWIQAAHVGTESDAVALEGLLGELDRPEWGEN